MAKVPLYTLSNTSGESGIFQNLDSDVSDLGQVSASSISSSSISSISASLGYLILDYDNIPTVDPLVRGAVWRDGSDFLKISSG
jgi:hypothetical protein